MRLIPDMTQCARSGNACLLSPNSMRINSSETSCIIPFKYSTRELAGLNYATCSEVLKSKCECVFPPDHLHRVSPTTPESQARLMDLPLNVIANFTKCTPREKGPCGNCLRRYPPPKCVILVVATLQATFREIPTDNVDNLDRPKKSARMSARQKSRPQTRTERKKNVSLAPQKASTGNPNPFGGMIDLINTLENLAIMPTRRNAELFWFYHRMVVPRFSSIDAEDTPDEYLQKVVPWMTQWPLMPQMIILMSSGIRALMKGRKFSTHPETLAIKSNILSLVNEYIRNNYTGIGIQAICVVLHLAAAEFMWECYDNMWAHLKGVKRMLQLHGGIGAVEDHYLVKYTILTDYNIAIFFERDLYLHDPEADKHFPLIRIQIPKTFPVSIYSPLYASPSPFVAHTSFLDLTNEAAEILDNIQFLITAITSSSNSPTKIQSTATWLHDRIKSIPEPHITPTSTPEELIAASIRLTALVYTTSIATLTPISKTFPESCLDELHTYVCRVGFTRWKQIPGIFLWIMLTACSVGEVRPEERPLRVKMSVTALAIGLVSSDCVHAYLKAFWGVQRWIAKEGYKGADVLGELYKTEECVAM